MKSRTATPSRFGLTAATLALALAVNAGAAYALASVHTKGQRYLAADSSRAHAVYVYLGELPAVNVCGRMKPA